MKNNNFVDPNEERYNMIIMQEIGLDVGPEGRVYDQDTGDAVTLNGVDLVGPTCYHKNRLRCHPWDNGRIMEDLFSYFLNKISYENDFVCSTFYDIFDDDDPKFSGLVVDGYNQITGEKMQYQSFFMYEKTCLKYLDVIMQFNGADLYYVRTEIIKNFGAYTGWRNNV